jgi:hypothetical protein
MKNPDRLYDLLPVFHRQRDAVQGYPLQQLLRVITEQVDVVEEDIAQLYENWFIETCDEWVVPYIGDLIGYQPVHEAGEPGDVTTARGLQRERILIPRQDVANTIRARRQKGTLALLEELAVEVAGWPGRAVEFYKLLGWTQSLHTPQLGRALYHTVQFGETLATIAALHETTVKHLLWLNPALTPAAALVPETRLLVGWRRARGLTADLRNGDALELVDGPFDRLSHTVEVRRIDSNRTQGRYNISSVGVFVWRLKTYSVTQTPAFCVDQRADCYTFSVLGNDAPLYNFPQPESTPTRSPGEINLPTAIRLQPFNEHMADYYGDGKSLQIWTGTTTPAAVLLSQIVAADLSGWHYQPNSGEVAVDPAHGRLAFAPGEAPREQNVWVSYYYAFSADIGGGEYERLLSQPAQYTIYRVGGTEKFKTINAALAQWQQDLAASPTAALQNVVIEITDSGLYEESISLNPAKNQTVQIRAANLKRPVISVTQTRAKLDALFISGDQGSRVILDGLLIAGRGVMVSGPKVVAPVPAPAPVPDIKVPAPGQGNLCDVTIRHCTLVPGWSLDCECGPCQGEEPSLVLSNTTACIKIEHSILGSIEVETNDAMTEPVQLCLSDSILDATENKLPALNGVESNLAYARLTMVRCTVFGEVLAHEIALAENCIFNAQVCVARRQRGCVRFCYLPPESRTPRRYECQPDLVINAVNDQYAKDQVKMTAAELAAALAAEQARVQPEFNSTRYGTPAYCQLADACAEEIKTGADDESEMGAFHDLYQPQRAANLRARLDDYTPAGMDAGIIYAT